MRRHLVCSVPVPSDRQDRDVSVVLQVPIRCRQRVRGAAGHDLLDGPVRAALPLPGGEGAGHRLRRPALLRAQATRQGLLAVSAQVRGRYLLIPRYNRTTSTLHYTRPTYHRQVHLWRSAGGCCTWRKGVTRDTYHIVSRDLRSGSPPP